MKISNIKKYNDKGFTLIELIIVIGGIAALGSFTFPNILASIKLNKIEEAKAIMNGYAADCLGKYRISTDPVEFIEKSTPDELDNIKLTTLGYQIDGNKNKCSQLAIKPVDERENDLYAFDFRMTSEGKILKTATPSPNPRFLNSCRGWAGKNCGLSEAQKAEFARLATIAKAKSQCLSNYNNWLAADSSGENISWDNENESCTRKVFAFEGIPVNSLEAVDQALKAKYGRACLDWRASKIKSQSISREGKSETKDPECGGVPYWFHSGNEFTSQTGWTAFDNQLKQQKCISDRSDALRKKKQGQYTYGPSPGPDPCGKVVWLCNGSEYNSLSSYKTTSCGKPPPTPPKPKPKPVPDRCKNFKRDKRCKPERKFRPFYKATSKKCTCP
tara:strand:- start:26 stop:1189 length:1164 start_codon:yes stop_codon:yes gene_type:complete